MTKNKIKKIEPSSNDSVSQIEIYQPKNGSPQIEIKLINQTLWLNQKQMSHLFDKDADTIGLHLKNIFDEGELIEKSTTEFFSVIQQEGERRVTRKIKHYNLDAIISVGYRVNSKQGTRFRIWATERLKNYLVKGFAINEKRVKEYQENLIELRKTIKLIQDSVELKELSTLESKGFLSIITNYTQSFILLNQFDSDSLNLQKLDKNITYEIAYEEACEAITELKKQLIKKKEASELFGNQKDQSFVGILGNITQSFGGEYL